jgi:hypothetical protein
MDTSKLQEKPNKNQPKFTLDQSLGKIEEKIRRQVNDLTFKRLGEHLAVDFSRKFEDRSYHMTRSNYPIAPLGLTYEARVFVIPIVEKFHSDGKGGVKKFELIELILMRSAEYLHWNILRDELSQVFSTIPTALYSKRAEIIYSSNWIELDFKLGKIDLPNDFLERVELAIGHWIKNSIKKREDVLKSLRKFQKQFPVPEEEPVAK